MSRNSTLRRKLLPHGLTPREGGKGGGVFFRALGGWPVSWKSTCFLKVSTLPTCTVTLSPRRITRRVRRPTSRLRVASKM